MFVKERKNESVVNGRYCYAECLLMEKEGNKKENNFGEDIPPL